MADSSLVARAARLASGLQIHAEAAALLTASRLALRLLPFHVVEPALGQRASDAIDSSEGGGTADRTCQRVLRAVARVRRVLPWDSTCLCAALAAKSMLRLRGAPGLVLIGVKKRADSPLEAHAWIECTGAASQERTNNAEFAAIAGYR